MKVLLILLFLFLPYSSYSTEISDPFVDPFKKLFILDSKYTHIKSKKTSPSLRIFKSVLGKNLKELKIEGIIGSANSYSLVVSDPATGKVYMLKPGDPISSDTKIKKITINKVILVKYYKKKKKLKKKLIELKVDKEG
ncbi:hypothetical protein GFV12_03310 [Desulfurobacterium thermolithotrophum]|uniref:hypothetical protein n=1 Tax=Desulfurobacterium thermolithotrophum TaxID=64160 RepID=UPI0013D1DABB|nr:hypothetical protein [Desulfurobacterium thermolithotrophum]